MSAPAKAAPASKSERIPAIGRIVTYSLSEHDATEINKRRAGAVKHLDDHRKRADGSQVHVGNPVRAGDRHPLIITRVWADVPTPTSRVNGQALLDGNDTHWVTSACEGEGHGKFTWPEIR